MLRKPKKYWTPELWANLQRKSGAELRDLGRLPYPIGRHKGDKGFRRVS